MASGAAERYFRVCVARDPYRRIVSAYLDKVCGDGRGAGWVQAVIHEAGCDGALSFEQLLGYLEAVNERVCNPHWRRQTYVLDDQRVDAFVRVERLQEEMSMLADIVGTAHLPMLGERLQTTYAGAWG